MGWRILQGNVFDTLPTIAPGSVDTVVTSPPYWMLRSYLPKGHPLKALELGSEKSPDEYVANMVQVMRLVRDTMADHATCFLNVGDTYCNAGSRNNGTGLDGKRRGGMQDTDGTWEDASDNYTDIRHSIGLDVGSLCLIPWRLALALQADGWLVRSVVVWHKPAPMPASVSGWAWRRCRVKVGKSERYSSGYEGWDKPQSETLNHKPSALAQWSDCPGCRRCEPNGGYVLRKGSWRCTSSWEPVIMLAKSRQYFCDSVAVQQPAASAGAVRQFGRKDAGAHGLEVLTGNMADGVEWTTPSTANPRDVWTVAAEPAHEKHYAAFPTELVARCLRAATSAKGYCPTCGGPWVRVVSEASGGSIGRSWHDHSDDGQTGNFKVVSSHGYQPATTLGWRPSCTCPAQPPRPAVVLDPFAGSGRTGVAARRLGLDFVGCELNPEYVAMANRKIEAALRDTAKPVEDAAPTLF